MSVVRESSLLSIVVLGDFNPAIFHPSWFAAEGLLREGEAGTAEVEVVHPDVSIFMAEWVRVQVTRERLLVQTERESHFGTLRDLAVSTLGVLRHSPTRVCGVNHEVTLAFRDRRSFDDFGYSLVPKDRWAPVLRRPGVASLLEQGERDDRRQGYLRVKVEPILDGSFRAVVGLNDHVVFDESSSAKSTRQIIEFLEHWEPIASRANHVLDHVQTLAG